MTSHKFLVYHSSKLFFVNGLLNSVLKCTVAKVVAESSK